ncbi:MAG: cytochrome c oxidase subunit II [Leptospiraceae bacterium]|nr:cytochrome c oxidase subunit II [Leptospiraceae bacterium]
MSWFSVILANTFMPVRGTDTAGSVDAHYLFLVLSSVVAFIILIGGMTLFIVKYRRKSDNDKTAYIPHNGFLEFLWSFIPFLIVMGVFYWGKVIYDDFRTFPDDAEEIHVTAQKWSWEFRYKNGVVLKSKEDKDALHIPLGKPVKLIITSRDVLHSFFIPGFRNKQDAVPGRYTALWFKATQEGEYQVFCTEYCGNDHSNMPARIKVVSPTDYAAWLKFKKENMPIDPAAGNELALKGKELATEKACSGCHSTTGTKMTGPTWKGLFGSKRDFEGGGSAVADENYIRESILQPMAKIVKGFPGAMPPYQGQLSDDDILAIIEYMKTLK